MAIFSFLARLGLDTTGFESGVKRAQSSAEALGKNIRGHIGGEIRGVGAALAGAFTLGAVKSFASSIAEMAGDIKDMADLLEISTDDVQKLMKAADDAAQPFSRVVSSLQRIESVRAKAMTGDDKARNLFSILGIDPSGGNAFEILQRTVEASRRGATENAAAFELLGSKVSGLRRVVDELQNQGQIKLLSEDDIKSIDDFAKAIKGIKRDIQLSVVQSGQLGFWARVAERGREIDQESKLGIMNFALSRAIAEEVIPGMLGDTRVRGLSTDPLPMPDRPLRQISEQDAAIQLLREMNNNTRRTADVLTRTTEQ